MQAGESLQVMAQKGLKITLQRRWLLESLQAGGHLSAAEIYARVRMEHPEVARGTIYRNLHLLQTAGLVRALDFRDGCCRYELADAHHHHFVCLRCGRVTAMDFCPVAAAVEAEAGRQHFRVTGHSFEVYGYCSGCR